MRKLIFYISAICICISCISSNSQTANSKDNAEIPFVSSPIPAYTASSPLEENLVNQFNIYIDAMRNGNVELVKQYLYSDLFAQYPADYKNRAYQTIVKRITRVVLFFHVLTLNIYLIVSNISDIHLKSPLSSPNKSPLKKGIFPFTPEHNLEHMPQFLWNTIFHKGSRNFYVFKTRTIMIQILKISFFIVLSRIIYYI